MIIAINITYSFLIAVSIGTLILAAITDPGIIPRIKNQQFDQLPSSLIGNNDFNVNEDNKYKYIINKKMHNKSILNFLDI